VKWALAAVGAIVALAVAAVVALPRVVDSDRVRALISASAAHTLARPVRFASASVTALPYPTVRLRGVEIAEDPAFGAEPFVRLDDADVRLRLWPLLRGRVEFATVVLRRPTITLARGQGGRWNFASLGGVREVAAAPRAARAGAGGPPAGVATRVVVQSATVVYAGRLDGTAARERLDDVDLTLSARPGGIAFSGAGRLATGGLEVKVSDGTLGLGGARTLADGALRARVEARAEDAGPLGALAIGPEPSISGTLVGYFEVAGTLGRPRAAGEVEWREATITRTNAACAEPRRRTLALATVKASVSWRDGRLVADPLATGIPRGTVRTRLVATTTASARADLAELTVEGVPVERVLVEFLCTGWAVAGPLDLTGTLALSGADPLASLSGRGRFRVGPGSVVGPRALALLGGLAREGAPIAFDSIAGSFEIVDGVVSTRDLAYTGRGLTMRARGDYALARGDVRADVVVERDRSVVQAKVTGSVDAPTIRTSTSLARHLDTTERPFRDLLKKFR
jgi:AsmA family/AsmA-like C-terminal region